MVVCEQGIPYVLFATVSGNYTRKGEVALANEYLLLEHALGACICS
jgi:hypothetical protein